MDINDTYNNLKALQLTKSQRHFSMTFLSKSPSYLSMLNATNRRPSTNTLINLSHHLSTIAADSDHTQVEYLSDLSRKVLEEALKSEMAC